MDTNILIVTALSIAFLHTLIGPDHYLPFIVIAKARGWSLKKTSLITLFCGMGHVLGSVILGLVGIALGTALNLLEEIESVRGEIASWLLIGFGLAYGICGLKIALRSREHTHEHEHELQKHTHSHHHFGAHVHLHGEQRSLTPWVLFVVFMLGPCEPLIPMLMFPTAQGNWLDIVWVVVAFGAMTISTMITVVALATLGIAKIEFQFMQKYSHATAGMIIAVSGLSIKFLGL